MKSTFKISFILLLTLFISLISGLFKDVYCFVLIIIIHELGHIIVSLYYKWKIKKIEIGILGGYITYEDILSKSFKEELLVSLGGITIQLILFIIFFIIYKYSFISERTYDMLYKYNLSIAIFNLLPIVPLDGSKILNILLNIKFSFKGSLYIILYCSLTAILTILTLVILHNVIIGVSYLLLLYAILKHIYNVFKDTPYIFNKFLFTIYLNKHYYSKKVYFNKLNINKLKRWKTNYFLVNNKYVIDREILSKTFDKTR